VIICAAGDSHGALDRLFDSIIAFEQCLGVPFDWVLHVGDLGIWPDPNRIDGATRRHDGAGDFLVWLAERRAAPRPTVFVKGNHEDFMWLHRQRRSELLPGLHYLPNAEVQEIGAVGEVLRVGGIGGCFGASDYDRPAPSPRGYVGRHYTHDDVRALSAHGDLDIVLAHEAPAGVRFEHHSRGDGFVSEAAGLDELLAATQPRVCLFGHHHARISSEVAGVPCVGLNKVGRPGNLVAIEMRAGERAWRTLGEWPAPWPAR
jgi:uncharacterized protein